MKQFRFILLFIVALTFYSCATTVNYLGDSFPATTNVETFFDPGDIERDYKVIGIVKNDTGWGNTDTDSIRKAMLKKAKSVGADAILYTGSDQVQETTLSGDPMQIQVYKAKFLKYK